VLIPQFNNLNFFDVLIGALYDSFCIHSTPKSEDEENDNKQKYYGKRVFTCIMSMDSYETTLIELPVEDDAVTSAMMDALFDTFSRQHGDVHEYYEYCKKNKPDNLSSMEFMRKDMEKDKNMLSYVDDYFRDVEKEIQSCSVQDRKYVIDRMLTKKESFSENLDKYLLESIECYMRDEDVVIDY
jgi:hypothetical protein